MSDLDAVPKRRLGARVRMLRGVQHVAVDPDVFELSEVGATIWRLSDGTRSLADISAMLGEEYDAEIEVIRSDVREFVDEMVSLGLMEWAGGTT